MVNDVKKAYKVLGKTSFYDGMITCSTISGRLVCKLVWNMNRKVNDEYLNKVLSCIPKEFAGRLLEVPVGTGILSMPIYKELPEAEITCLDYSEEMMNKAKILASDIDIHNVNFICGDAGNLPFEDSGFDIVLSMNGFHAFSNKEAAFYEILRVLKPGGIFCGCFYVKGENRRTDWFVNHIYTHRGFFSPPFETKESLNRKLRDMYSYVSLQTVEAMACFNCRKSSEGE